MAYGRKRGNKRVDDLIIFGAGGLGRELLEIIEEINAERQRWNLLGFVDDGVKERSTVCGYPVLGGFDFFRSHSGRTGIVIGFADCAAKEAAYNSIKEIRPGFYFPVIIHPGSYISPRAALDEGAVVSRGCFVSVETRLGKCVLLSNKCEVAHDSTVGDFASLMPSVNISGNVAVGKRTFVGVRAAVRQGLIIGSDAVIGMGSTVIKDVPDGCTAVGTPAKIISRRDCV